MKNMYKCIRCGTTTTRLKKYNSSDLKNLKIDIHTSGIVHICPQCRKEMNIPKQTSIYKVYKNNDMTAYAFLNFGTGMILWK